MSIASLSAADLLCQYQALSFQEQAKFRASIIDIDPLMTILRDKTTPPQQFRETAQRLSHHLAKHVISLLPHEKMAIITPVGPMEGVRLKAKVVLVPVIRSGLALVDTFLSYFPNATVRHIGMQRDEQTAIAKTYYSKIEHIDAEDYPVVLEPMIATGGSATETLSHLIRAGASPDHIIFASYIAATEGLERIKASYPTVRIAVVQVDEKLNEKKFIDPGLGDFGDRYYGTL